MSESNEGGNARRRAPGRASVKAIISDIHSNFEALQAVLKDIEKHPVTDIYCLGDVIGYGPHPNECCALIRERTSLCLSGNHDLAVVGGLDVSDFSGDAAVAVRWTQDVLEAGHADWLRSLAPRAEREGVQLFHGSPRDPVWDYVLTFEAVDATFELTEEPLVLVGHSHVPLALASADGALGGGLAPEGTEVELAADARLILNPGSVGQPRDGDPRAAWLLLDFDAGRASFRRVEYPVVRTQEEIRERGLPDSLAGRLAGGV